MADKKIPITKKGLEELKAKYQDLIHKRTEIAERLEVARAQGDLSENSEYDEAKEAQTKNEKEIQETEYVLKNYEIVNGTFVKVYDEDLDEESEYNIVGSTEADAFSDPPKISNESPLGKALLNGKPGDKVEVEAPNCKYFVTIKEINNAD